MAKRKFVSLEEYKKAMKPDVELSFDKKLPFLSLNSPSKTIFTAWHGNLPVVLLVGAHGTAYTVRADINHWNVDVYSILYDNESENFTVKYSFEEYHKIGEGFDYIPEFLKKEIPEKTKKEIESKK